ncbi:MAG: CHAT domain-containing protein [Actinobacteria bacterium]|nr:CHAT domain-containing protein [Actinomycetota bacterium]
MTEAEELLRSLRAIPPQQATAQTVAGAERAVSLLAHDAEGSLRAEATGLLASHLLEVQTGDRVANVERAQALYREMRTEPEVAPGAWVAGTFGLANALLLHPEASSGDIALASQLSGEVIDRARSAGDVPVLVRALGQKARIESAIHVGDIDAHLENAIALQKEAVDVLMGSADPVDGVLLGRQWHNLAGLYEQRRTGVRADNIDRAVRALMAALEFRPADVDPVGRARTLRALARVFPEWTGPDSIAEADRLGQAAAAEAEALEASDPRGVGPVTGWANFERQRSALTAVLPLDELPPDRQRSWLEGAIANHREAVEAYPRPSIRWAEWMGGLGRLLGRLPHLGTWDQIEAAYTCFGEALTVVDPEDHPRLRRYLLSRWGELCHEIGDFEGSLYAYGEAAELGNVLLDQIADPEDRWTELETARGDALFAAFAAARLGMPEDSAYLAELGRSRTVAELLIASDVASRASAERRQEILDAVDAIRGLEVALRDLQQGDLVAMQRKVADLLGVTPAFVQMRSVGDGYEDDEAKADERDRLASALAHARTSLRRLLMEDGSEGGPGPLTSGYEGVVSAAREAGLAVVYVMATVHGAAAVVVTPEGACESTTFDGLDSSVVGALIRGTDEVPGFAAAMRGKIDGLDVALEAIAMTIGTSLMAPLGSWLAGLGVTRVALIPLGRLGLLPLHIATTAGITYSYAPCARALSRAAIAPAPLDLSRVVIVADPSAESCEDLPLALAEARGVAELLGPHGGVDVGTASDADFDHLRTAAPGASVLHLACHGEFRPADPLESHLLLAGDDRLSLADVFARRVDLGAVRLMMIAACRSGTVEFERAPDEALGFPAALMVGGVPTIVSTLWPVDDGDEVLGEMAAEFSDLPLAIPYSGTQDWGAFVTTGLHG